MQVEALSRAEISEAVNFLCREFQNDPCTVVYTPEIDRRLRLLKIIFSDSVSFYYRFGNVFVGKLGGVIIGIAVCVPPDSGRRSLNYRIRNRLRGMLTKRRLDALSPDLSAKMFEGYATADSHHPAEPHWNPMFVAIASGFQRKGYGVRLLTPMLRHADANGVSCFVETPFESNLGFFRKLGFELRSEAVFFRGVSPNFIMIRKPRRAAAEGPLTPAASLDVAAE